MYLYEKLYSQVFSNKNCRLRFAIVDEIRLSRELRILEVKEKKVLSVYNCLETSSPFILPHTAAFGDNFKNYLAKIFYSENSFFLQISIMKYAFLFLSRVW